MHRHTISPITETRMMAGMAAAPIAWTAKGTMPVTRMMPARPITKAPHQLVPRWSEVATSVGGPPVTLVSVLMASSPLGQSG